MDRQIQEPEYYTLAEVAERLEVSAGVLVRLGAENKILICYPLFFKMAYVVRPTQNAGCKGFEALSAEMLSAIGKIEGAAEAFDGIARFPVEGFALCNRDIKIAIANGLDYFRLDFVEGIISMPKLPPAHHYVLLRPVSAASFADLVIPTSEIHRIEHQQEKADQVIAKAEAESPIPSQSKRALNTRAKVIGALVKSHNINLSDRGAASALNKKLELQGVGLDPDTVRTILKEAKEQIEKPN